MGVDPTRWIEQYGDCLFRFALLRVHDRTVAEDLVQDTFLAALQGQERFADRASERTWLIGILRHKLIDYFRRVSRTEQGSVESINLESSRDFFTEAGRWRDHPGEWNLGARDRIESKEFWQVWYHCLSSLPASVAHAFVLREIEGLSSKEVCEVLNLTPTNLWTRLYRARLHMRQCLECKWFNDSKDRDMP